jgi:peroxiredoxin
MTARAGAAVGLVLLITLIAVAWLLWPGPLAPQATFKLIDGRQVSLTELQGRPVLINFWSTSCPSCVAEMPDLAALHHDYSERGLTIIGVAMPYDPPNRVLELAAARKLPYGVALDLDTQLVRAFGDVRVTPTHILVDPHGRIVERHTGPLSLARTRQRLEQLLEES